MFHYLRDAQYHETDQMGIIHHSNYIKWMEEARTAYLASTKTDYKAVEEMGIISPVVSLEVDYKKPVKYEDRVDISVWIHAYNGIVMEFKYRFYNQTTNEICTEAHSRHCFLKNGKIASLRKAAPEFDRIFTEQYGSDKGEL